MKRLLLLLIAVALIGAPATAQVKASATDKAAIKVLVTSFQDAWNRHEMQALSALVSKDVDFVNVSGMWFKNRKEFEEYHLRLHQMRLKESRLVFPLWKSKQNVDQPERRS